MIKSTQRLKIQPNISSDTMSFTKLLHILTLAVVFMAAVIIPKGYSFSTQCTTLDNNIITNISSNNFVSKPISDKMIFMPDYKITCSGLITEWEVQMNGQGTTSLEVVFTVWRPSEVDQLKYELVGNNSLTLTNIKDVCTYHLIPNKDQQIAVQPGYVIGLYISTPNGPSSAVHTLELDTTSERYSTYYIDSEVIQKSQTLLDVGTTSDTRFNQIPLISAKIISTNPLASDDDDTPSIEATTSTTSSLSSHTHIATSASATPTTLTDSVLIGPIVAIVILVIIIIIGILVFVLLMCYTVHRRSIIRNKNSNRNNNKTDDKRKSIMSQLGFPVSRNPSYSSTTLSTRSKAARSRAVSEHVYESCYDPYEYMGPACLEENLPEIVCKPATRLSSSDIYEVPFGNTLPSRSTCAPPPYGINNLYVATATVHQPPVSPGYEVPVCPPDAIQKHLSFEESVKYKEPGWVYHS